MKKLCSKCKKQERDYPQSHNTWCSSCLKESNQLWYQNNKEHSNSKSRLWRFNNKKRVSSNNEHWRKNNPEKRAANEAKRRARKQKVVVKNQPAIRKIYKRAKELRRWFDVVVDHIIPLAKGGSHSPENLQIIYASDNVKKHTRLDFKPMVIFI